MRSARLAGSLALLILAISPCSSRAAAGATVPFAFGDFTWMNGQSRQRSQPLVTPYGTASLYLDVYQAASWAHPIDHTLVGSSTVGRDREWQVNIASAGFESSREHVLGRVMLQTGAMTRLVQRSDGSVARGRNLSTDDLSLLREANAGYHWDAMHGVDLEGGVFSSYLGLESALTGENWNHEHALVSAYTPFYLQGVRFRVHPTDHVRLESWLVNGWQSYAQWNRAPALGLAITYRPQANLGIVADFYRGADSRNNPERTRFHHDHSVIARDWYREHAKGISAAAFSLNNHLGFEQGGSGPDSRHAYAVGSSLAHRVWFHDGRYALTLRGEALRNPTRYLAPAPTADGFPGDPADTRLTLTGFTATIDMMPTDFATFRVEYVSRHADIPFFAGPGGTTSLDGFSGTSGAFTPDLRQSEQRVTVSMQYRL